jgi:hypothetical protein
MKTGTPKTVADAIAQALQELWGDSDNGPWIAESHEVQTILARVRDRLSQDFGAAALEETDALTLWKRIFPKGRL